LSHPDYSSTDPRDHAVDATEVNQQSLWAMYAVFSVDHMLPADVDLGPAVASASDAGVDVRGWYDLGGFRADADLLIWWTADSAEALQAAYHGFRNSDLGHFLAPAWSTVATHQPSSTSSTCRVASPASLPATGARCTPSSAATSGTCWTRPSVRGCCANTA